MAFSALERQALLALKGVGPRVVERFEEMGFDSLAKLAKADVSDILSRGAAMTGSSCWKNSPQARKAIEAAIELARGGGEVGGSAKFNFLVHTIDGFEY